MNELTEMEKEMVRAILQGFVDETPLLPEPFTADGNNRKQNVRDIIKKLQPA